MYSYTDFGKTFTIDLKDIPNSAIQNKFYNSLSEIDNEIVEYYKSLITDDEIYFNLYLDSSQIGYSKIINEHNYALLVEIYVIEEYQELGLGTFMLNTIRKYLNEKSIKLRTITLPGDRIAKNFYEANGITARVLLMEEKRDKSRNRS